MKRRHSTIGVLFSGGLDSAVLLNHVVEEGRDTTPFYVRTDCRWEQCELLAVNTFLAAVARPNLRKLIVCQLPLSDLYGDHWSMSATEVPSDTSPDEAVYLPGRNPLLLIKPALWCTMHGIEQLALATLASNPFADARPEFFARFEAMMSAAGATLSIVRPFERLAKDRVLEMGKHLPLELTFSCLAPVDGLHCGRCNKCAERRAAFGHLRRADPTRYASQPTASAR